MSLARVHLFFTPPIDTLSIGLTITFVAKPASGTHTSSQSGLGASAPFQTDV